MPKAEGGMSRASTHQRGEQQHLDADPRVGDPAQPGGRRLREVRVRADVARRFPVHVAPGSKLADHAGGIAGGDHARGDR